MSVQINYKVSILKKNSEKLVFFVDDKFKISSLRKYFSKTEYSYISDLVNINNKKNQIITYDISSKKRIVLVSVKEKVSNSGAENLGARFYEYLKNSKLNNFTINTDTLPKTIKNFISHFLHGLKLKSYIFEKYKSKKQKEKIIINVIGKNKPSIVDQIKFKAIEEGTFYGRDLVSEPGNILHPDEYAKRISSLKKIGLKVTVYNEKK